MKNFDDDELRWTRVSEKTLLKTRVFDVAESRSRSPKGDERRFFTLKSPDWAMVVPLIRRDGKDFFVMVRQWRHGEGGFSCEFPGGVVDAGETPEEAALRELREETGLVAKSLAPLGSVSPNPALMQNSMHFFAATEFEDGKAALKLDEDEFLNAFAVEKDEAVAKFGSREWRHAMAVCALHFFLQKFGK